jgi:hypothetical protein
MDNELSVNTANAAFVEGTADIDVANAEHL